MSLLGQSDSSLAPGLPVPAAGLSDYVALLKPRVMSLVVF
ncbi:MAG: protoheme IX farnesyltransferase, partial [Beijerinckiaceae bacterium]|nr:protoheme IX farnesyltransferase [Beijerinckiaceae bacterium]